MRLGRLGEKRVLKAILAACRTSGPGVRVGIGDDAAVTAVSGNAGPEMLVTSDMLVEGVHFDLSYTGYRELGYRALACNVSDIAAMGGEPSFYLVSFALGPDTAERELRELYEGMDGLAAVYGMTLIGGDTSAAGPGSGAVISITVMGSVPAEGPILRSGASPGEDIYVSGSLGDSAAGLEILKAAGGAAGADVRHAKGHGVRLATARTLGERHIRPRPRVELGRALAETCAATAMMDISDGLGIDLSRLLEASGVGAEIEADRLPVSDELAEYAGGRDEALVYALSGGDDYELLFTAPRGRRGSVRDAAWDAGVKVSRIGRIIEGEEAYIIGRGGRELLGPVGYEHFG